MGIRGATAQSIDSTPQQLKSDTSLRDCVNAKQAHKHLFEDITSFKQTPQRQITTEKFNHRQNQQTQQANQLTGTKSNRTHRQSQRNTECLPASQDGTNFSPFSISHSGLSSVSSRGSRGVQFQVGLLDYDNYLRNPYAHPSKRSKFDITVRFPNALLKEQESAFVDPHASMQAEAEEQYNMLVAIQGEDAEFNQVLVDYHYRKLAVEEALASSKDWRQFATKIYKHTV